MIFNVQHERIIFVTLKCYGQKEGAKFTMKKAEEHHLSVSKELLIITNKVLL